MKKTIQLLSALLAVQVLLAVGLGLTGPNLSARADDAPLLAMKKGGLDHITIEGPDKAEVVLAKEAGTWRLPQVDDFPADADRIGQLIDRLESLKRGLPVATSSGASKRFKVSEASFERRITLGDGGKTLATLFLGTSPSMREVHARRAGRKDVYTVDFATYDVPVKAEDWEDKDVLRIPEGDIWAIDVNGLHITRTAEAAATAVAKATAAQPAGSGAIQAKSVWRASGEHLKPQAADDLAERLANLNIGAVLGTQAKPGYGLTQPVLSLTVTRKNGQRIGYRLGKMSDGQAYALKSSTRSEYFRLPLYAAEPLVEAAQRGTLLAAKATARRTADKKRPRRG
jgi:hypothetical protein